MTYLESNSDSIAVPTADRSKPGKKRVYRISEEVKKLRAKTARDWLKANPEKAKAARDAYYARHKEVIALRRRRDRLYMRLGKGQDVLSQIHELTTLINSKSPIKN